MRDAERGEVTIRTAREADAAQIAELATQLGYAATEPDMRERLQTDPDAHRGLGDRRRTWRWPGLRLDHGGLGHFADLGRTRRSRRTGRRPAMRGMGIGSLLLQAAVNWARIQGYAEIRVHSNTIRERAHQFYEREGFGRIKTQVLFGKKT